MTTDRRDPTDPARFREDGHRLVDQLADYLQSAAAGRDMPVVPATPPGPLLDRWSTPFPEEPGGELGELVARLLADSTHIHHPRYVGYQVTPTLPVAVLADLAASLLNNGMAAFEGGPAATVMEARVVAWMAQQLGWDTRADGVLTSGGSLGNLTALLTARQVKAGFDVWSGGAHRGPPLAVLVGEYAHYSVARALQIMGWGADGAVPVASDNRFRMRPAALAQALAQARAAGRKVIAVVGSAGSTATGAFDPLADIADFCGEHKLWFHVDGAHGASAALSPKHRPLLAGIERADSVVWDAHKMLAMPALATAVLFREGGHSYEAFAQEAAYLFPGSDVRAQWYNRGLRTAECTKRMISVPLFASLSLLGTNVFTRLVDDAFALALRFGERLTAAADFELCTPPECNIVCFRFVPPGAHDLDALQTRVQQQLGEHGAFFVAKTTLQDHVWLRTSLMNPRTTDADLGALLDAIRALPAA